MKSTRQTSGDSLPSVDDLGILSHTVSITRWDPSPLFAVIVESTSELERSHVPQDARGIASALQIIRSDRAALASRDRGGR